MTWKSNADFLADLDKLSDFAVVNNSQLPRPINKTTNQNYEKKRIKKRTKYYEADSDEEVEVNSNGRLSYFNKNKESHLQVLNEISTQVNMVFGNLYHNKKIEETFYNSAPSTCDNEGLVFSRQYNFLTPSQKTHKRQQPNQNKMLNGETSVTDNKPVNFLAKPVTNTGSSENIFPIPTVNLHSDYTHEPSCSLNIHFDKKNMVKDSKNYQVNMVIPNTAKNFNINSKEEFPLLL